VQHMWKSLRERGRMAVVLDTGAVSRGSGSKGSNRERDIRQRFVEADVVEAVVLLPDNLFYNTPAPGIVMLINQGKRHPGEMLLINASQQFEKRRPKNHLADEHIDRIADAYDAWTATKAWSRAAPFSSGHVPQSVQSPWVWIPGPVSKRSSGAAVSDGRSSTRGGAGSCSCRCSRAR